MSVYESELFDKIVCSVSVSALSDCGLVTVSGRPHCPVAISPCHQAGGGVGGETVNSLRPPGI